MFNRRFLTTSTVVVLGAVCLVAYQNCAKFSSAPFSAQSQSSLTPPQPGPSPDPTPSHILSVTQYHNQSNRNGIYVDAAFTAAAAATLHADPNFQPPATGTTYAQPLFLAGTPNLVIVATEQDNVYGINADTGTVVWTKNLGTPVPLSTLPCGNIDPLGITGTPVIDSTSRTIYLDAMVSQSGTPKHLIYALSADNGAIVSGWPVQVANISTGGVQFDSSVQNQRGALLLLNGTLYVPYGGHYGDCGTFHGWVVAVPVNDPASATGWATAGTEGGIWGPPGLASDGQSVFVATGNSASSTNWSQGEAMIRLTPSPSFSGSTQDYWAPTNWKFLDVADIDLGSSGALLVDVPGASPNHLGVLLGKDGNMYLLNRDNLGGITAPVGIIKVTTGHTRSGSAVFNAGSNVQVVFNGDASACPAGQSGDLIAVQIASATPPTMSVAWCAAQNGGGSPIVTSPDGQSQFVVWGLGAGGDNQLHAFDGLTGHPLFSSEALEAIQIFQTPIVANGRIYVSTNGKLHAFVP